MRVIASTSQALRAFAGACYCPVRASGQVDSARHVCTAGLDQGTWSQVSSYCRSYVPHFVALICSSCCRGLCFASPGCCSCPINNRPYLHAASLLFIDLQLARPSRIRPLVLQCSTPQTHHGERQPWSIQNLNIVSSIPYPWSISTMISRGIPIVGHLPPQLPPRRHLLVEVRPPQPRITTRGQIS